MKKLLIFPLLLLLSGIKQPLKALGLEISSAQYMTAEQQPYLELFFALNGSTLGINQNDEGRYYGGIEVTVMFRQGEEIKAADKFRILSPAFDDSNRVAGTFIQQQRFLLNPGEYNLFINVADISTPENVHEISQKMTIDDPQDQVHASDLLFLNDYKPAGESSTYSKSGYELIPMVSSGNYYFPENREKLSFYVELYNVAGSIGENENYLVRYFIRNYDSEQPLDKYSSFSKKSASNIQPVLASFNISELPTGNYELVVLALDKEGNEILKDKVFFFRQNKTIEIDPENITEEQLAGTFASRIDNFDSLYHFVHYLSPISSPADRNMQQSLLRERDKIKMQQYLYAFWLNEAPADPERAWLEYKREVYRANELYGTRILEGFLTARGRVYLVYGKPTMVEQRKFEPGLPPFEIWQYNKVDSKYAIPQTNRIFVFAEFEPSTNFYELIHSTAYGELSNRRWQFDLAQGTYGTGSSIDQNRIPGSDFGSRLNNNIIFQNGSGEGSQINR